MKRVVFCLLIAVLAGSAGDRPPAPVAQNVVPTSPYDGIYKGPSGGIPASHGNACGKMRNSISVRGSEMEYQYRTGGWFKAHIESDGSFHASLFGSGGGSIGVARFDGRIDSAKGMLTADADFVACKFHLEFPRQAEQ